MRFSEGSCDSASSYSAASAGEEVGFAADAVVPERRVLPILHLLGERSSPKGPHYCSASGEGAAMLPNCSGWASAGLEVVVVELPIRRR